ncbi:MAG: hypothetical protein IJO62_03160 [Clostridia bacterium]|nr:hypothetical protein [Clostridia bacterium]
MAEIVFILVFAFPAILGLAEILHSIRLWFMSSGKKGKRILIVVPDNENYLKQILGIYEQSKWQGEKLAEKVIVLDTLLDCENYKECEKLVKRLNFEMCSKSKILDIVIKEEQ